MAPSLEPRLRLWQAGDRATRLLRRVDVTNPTSLDACSSPQQRRCASRSSRPEGVIREVSNARASWAGAGRARRAEVGKPDDRPARSGPSLIPGWLPDKSRAGHLQGPGRRRGRSLRPRRSVTMAGLARRAASGASSTSAATPRRRRLQAQSTSRGRAVSWAPEYHRPGAAVRRRSGAAWGVRLRRGPAIWISIEGLRGEPHKPPFPVNVGVFGKPTLIDNVETLVNVLDPPSWEERTTQQYGTPVRTRLFCLSGCVTRQSAWFGTTLGQMLTLAGGVAGGRPLQGILLGGAAGVFVRPDNRHQAHLEGHPGGSGNPRLRRHHGLRRRHDRPGAVLPSHHSLLSRRWPPSVRTLPSRDRPAGGGAPWCRAAHSRWRRLAGELALLG